jgi:PAB1-binding protein PBP1
MPALDTAEANRLLAASLNLTAYTAPTGPMKLALTSSVPTAGSAGTEVTGGSYARFAITGSTTYFPATPTSGSWTNSNGAISFTGMPAVTTPGVQGVEIWDSNGTPRRAFFGSLTVAKITAAGDTLTFATSQLTVTQS